MTLFLLLVSIAAIAPFAMVASDSANLGILGSLAGFCLAAAIGACQFIGHHKLVGRLQGKAGWAAQIVVVVYYCSILGIGVLLSVLTLHAAQFAARFLG